MEFGATMKCPKSFTITRLPGRLYRNRNLPPLVTTSCTPKPLLHDHSPLVLLSCFCKMAQLLLCTLFLACWLGKVALQQVVTELVALTEHNGKNWLIHAWWVHATRTILAFLRFYKAARAACRILLECFQLCNQSSRLHTFLLASTSSECSKHRGWCNRGHCILGHV